MKSIIFGLTTFVAAASAQYSGWGEVAASYASPSATASSDCVSSGGSGCGDASSSASSSTMTAAPSSSPAYDSGYYSSFTQGGYSSMNCGYGYSKDSKGYCQKQSWVCDGYTATSLMRAMS
jgi:hypothetical protein